ncbi:MAG: zinc-dependent alcohol dehydrogenase family protein [Bacillota bacterium]
MKAAVFEKPGSISLKKVDIPELSPEEVLIKVKASGICGTDHHIYQGEAPASFPVIPGHEMSGIIEKTGEKVSRLNSGDRVAVNPNIHCGTCYYCQRGEVNLCKNLQAVGVTRDGGFAEFVTVPETNVHKIEDNISFSAGAMIEPVSCCLHGIDLARIKPGAKVVILGGGAIGLILAQLARESGAAEVFISEPEIARQELAGNLGFKNVFTPDIIDEKLFKKSPVGADVVVEAVGIENTVKQSLELVRNGGNILFFGVCPEELTVPISPFAVYKRELTIKGSNINPFVTERAIEILNKEKIEVEKLVTHQYDLSVLPEIFSGNITNSGLKSIITF